MISFGAAGAGGYALAEPFRLRTVRYRLTPPGWTRGPSLRVAVMTDIHACEPWMPLQRIREIVATTNRLLPDVVFLLGDYVAGDQLGQFGEPVGNDAWAGALSELRAPLGVHAILGNHDWWEDPTVQETRAGPIGARIALEAHGIPVYENDVVRLDKDGLPFWVAGLGDQWAFWPRDEDYDAFVSGGKVGYTGVDDLAGTLAKVTDDAPVLLMVHEPDVFPGVPDRVSVTFAGHTHGGQVCLGGYAPIVPSKYGRRYVYGHIVEEGRNLIVSGGLGCSGLPVRFGVPPEIVIVEIGAGSGFA